MSATYAAAADTVRPPAYPELEWEVYRAADDVADRQTEIPPPSTQRELCVRSAGARA